MADEGRARGTSVLMEEALDDQENRLNGAAGSEFEMTRSKHAPTRGVSREEL